MIEWQDDKDVFGRMYVLTDEPLFKNLRNAVNQFDADFSDALSWGQLKSKRWLVESLIESNKLVLASTNGQQSLQLDTIFLCGEIGRAHV